MNKLDVSTLEQIDKWIDEQQDRANSTEWTLAYRLGFQMGLIAIQSKIDTYRKLHND